MYNLEENMSVLLGLHFSKILGYSITSHLNMGASHKKG